MLVQRIHDSATYTYEYHMCIINSDLSIAPACEILPISHKKEMPAKRRRLAPPVVAMAGVNALETKLVEEVEAVFNAAKAGGGHLL